MPLPHFLLLVIGVILAAGATLWGAVQTGLPLGILAIAALIGAVLLHLTQRRHDDNAS